MSGIFTGAHSFRRGCLGKKGRILFLLVNDALARENNLHTCVVVWDSGRFIPITTTGWSACSAVYLNWVDAEFVVIGEDGHLLKIREDLSFFEERLPVPNSADLVLRGAACAGECLVVVGAGFYCCSLSRDGNYKDISPRLLGGNTEGCGLGFEAVAGTSLSDIVAVGWSGAIWCFNGKSWEAQSSPTNLILSDIVILPDGEVWICGQHGMVIRGKRGEWRALDTGLSQNLWSLTPYGGGVIAASTQELFRFELDSDTPQSIGLDSEPTSFYWLDSKSDNVLLSTGAKNAVLLVPDREIVID